MRVTISASIVSELLRFSEQHPKMLQFLFLIINIAAESGLFFKPAPTAY
jgi:hypothetical protein